MVLVSVWHSMVYRYASEVARSTQYVRLRPRISPLQKVHTWTLELPGSAVRMIDALDNLTDVLTLDAPHREIRVLAQGRVELRDEGAGEPVGRVPARVFLRTTPLTAAPEGLGAWLEGLGWQPDTPAAAAWAMLSEAVRAAGPGGAAPWAAAAPEPFLTTDGLASSGHAVHSLLAAARALGLPARYVSGYACYADQSQWSLHSWAQVWHADRWQRLDPALDPGRPCHYLGLAAGLDELDACPVRGLRLGGGEMVVVSNTEAGVASL